MDIETLEGETTNTVLRVVPWIAWACVFVPLTLLTWRRFRRHDLRFAAAVSLLVAVIPTTWSSYQSLLIVPWLTVIAHFRREMLNRTSVALLVFTFLGGWINMYDAWYRTLPFVLSIIRTALPFVLWELLRRIDAASTPEEGIAARRVMVVDPPDSALPPVPPDWTGARQP